MAKDHIVYQSIRLNVIIPQHEKINKVLKDLSSVWKSKNQFFIDAAEYYIEHMGEEKVTTTKDVGVNTDVQYVTKTELESVIKELKQEREIAIRDTIIKLQGGVVLRSAPVESGEDKASDGHGREGVQVDTTVESLVDKWS